MSDIVHHKLVRYKITEINAAAGKQPVTRALSGEEYLANQFRRFENMQMLRHTKALTAEDKAEIIAMCDKKLEEYYARFNR